MNEKDYPEICSWWTAHGWAPIAEDLLPRTRLVIEGLCAGFLYKTDSNFAVLEWVVGNPKADKGQRRIALDLLIQGLLKVAKESGFTTVWTQLEHPALIERYENHGFQIGDKNLTGMIRRL